MAGNWRWIRLDRTTPSGKQLWVCSRCGVETPTPDKWQYHQPVCLKVKPAKVYPLDVFSLGEEAEWLVSRGHHDPKDFLTAACLHVMGEQSLADPGEAFMDAVWDKDSHRYYLKPVLAKIGHGWARWVRPNMVSWGGDFDTYLVINDGENGPVVPGPGAFPITYVVTH